MDDCDKVRMNQLSGISGRQVSPNDLVVPPGYTVDVYAQGLNFPVNMVFTENGDLLIGESGYFNQFPRVVRYKNGQFDVIAENFFPPLSGINYRSGEIYVAHNGHVTRVRLFDGSRRDIITGLPSKGDFANNKVEFGPDNKIYFGIGTTSNSGIVGPDNKWVNQYPLLYDYPGEYVLLKGQNYESTNFLLPEARESAYTGAFAPYSVTNIVYEVRKGILKASGSILKANLDGSEMEMVAWGFRNPVRLKFDRSNRLFAANQGYDNRGSRPIANATDDLFVVTPDVWYGWPDFSSGESVNSIKFAPDGGLVPELLLAAYPDFPPTSYASFPPNSTIMGFDINYGNFGLEGDIYVAEFGSVWPKFNSDITPNPAIGHKISKIDVVTHAVTTFAINRYGFPPTINRPGGFGWPTDVVFGPDGALYVLDFGTNPLGSLTEYLPNTGVIWRIQRTRN